MTTSHQVQEEFDKFLEELEKIREIARSVGRDVAIVTNDLITANQEYCRTLYTSLIILRKKYPQYPDAFLDVTLAVISGIADQ